MWDTILTNALTTISPLLVSLFTLTKPLLTCESFYIFKSVSRQELRIANTTLNPSCGWRHNSNPDASRHPSQESNLALIPFVGRLKQLWNLY